MVPPSEQPSTAPHEGGDVPLLHMLPNAEIHVIVAGVSAVPNLRAGGAVACLVGPTDSVRPRLATAGWRHGPGRGE